jgi:3-(3-hydroxy-phenyl)propionate hydroxylase
MNEHAVVIAGGGPTGLMLAGETGVGSCRHRRAARKPRPCRLARRAASTHARLRYSISGESPFASFRKGRCSGVLDVSDLPSRHNYYLALWQTHIERILADLGRRVGGAGLSRT